MGAVIGAIQAGCIVQYITYLYCSLAHLNSNKWSIKAHLPHFCNIYGMSWVQSVPWVLENPLAVFLLYPYSNRLWFFKISVGGSA